MCVKAICRSLSLMLSLGVGSAHAAAPEIAPGLWEIKTRTEVPGVKNPMPPMVFTRCVEDGDSRKLRFLPKMEADCQMADYREEADRVQWNMFCGPASGGMTGTGTLRGGRDSFETVLDFTRKGPDGRTMRMIQRHIGRRIGECF